MNKGGIMQRLLIDGCTGSYTLLEQEQLSTALLNALICEAQTANLLNLDLLMDVCRVNAERGVLEAPGQFSWAGTVSVNRDQQSVTYAIFRKSFRTHGDMNFAVATPQLAPSPLEVSACEEARQRYSEPLSDAKLQQLAAIGKQPAAIEKPEKPDLLIENLRHEIDVMSKDLQTRKTSEQRQAWQQVSSELSEDVPPSQRAS